MKRFTKNPGWLPVLVVSIFQPALYAQISFGPGQLIAGDSAFVHVHAGDLDSDGDHDVVACKYSVLLWYRNDGLGNFGLAQEIVSGQGTMQSVYLADLDGDSDLDIVSESNQTSVNSQVAWYRNDGSGNFGPKIIITDQINRGHCIFAADLDGDGDNDVLSASVLDDKIAWYRNDGTGVFGPQQIIATTDGASTVYASDIDGDGDNDVLAGGAYSNSILWYENTDGSGTFGIPHYISGSAVQLQFAYTADLDFDGDEDVYFAALGNDKIAWFQNDGAGNFGTEHLIDYEPNATDVCAQDLDGDYDLDIVSTSDEGTLSWFENNGLGEFGQQIVISSDNNRSVYSADVNGDDKPDIITASFFGQKVAWYKNMGTMGVFSPRENNRFLISPVPCQDYISIGSEIPVVRVDVTNGIGESQTLIPATGKLDVTALQ